MGGCELCAQNPSRRCSDNFSAKYLSGDSLLARCGASIRVEVIDRVTGDAVQDDSLASVQLEVGFEVQVEGYLHALTKVNRLLPGCAALFHYFGRFSPLPEAECLWGIEHRSSLSDLRRHIIAASHNSCIAAERTARMVGCCRHVVGHRTAFATPEAAAAAA